MKVCLEAGLGILAVPLAPAQKDAGTPGNRVGTHIGRDVTADSEDPTFRRKCGCSPVGHARSLRKSAQNQLFRFTILPEDPVEYTCNVADVVFQGEFPIEPSHPTRNHLSVTTGVEGMQSLGAAEKPVFGRDHAAQAPHLVPGIFGIPVKSKQEFSRLILLRRHDQGPAPNGGFYVGDQSFRLVHRVMVARSRLDVHPRVGYDPIRARLFRMVAPLTHAEVLRWRKEFPILGQCTYLINNSLGAMPRQTRDQLQEYCRAWESRGVESWTDNWWEFPRRLGDLLSGLFGAGPDEVSIQPNVTTAEWVACSAIPRHDGRNKVVYSEFNFPSVRYFYQSQPKLEIDVVPSDDGLTVPLERLLDAIDETTLLVPISHVLFKSGYIQDVRAIVERAHSVGAYVILDTYHSCGVVPFSVKETDPDFVVGGVLKWLCGGPGVAFLWVNPRLSGTLTPRLTGWLAHQDPFAFEEEMAWTSGAYRFLSGTPNVPGLYAATSGVETILRVGVERIRERSTTLTNRVIDQADRVGIEVRCPRDPAVRGGHVTLTPPGAETVARKLVERGFYVDYRRDFGIRIAPHFYNTLDEIDSVVQEIKSLSE